MPVSILAPCKYRVRVRGWVGVGVRVGVGVGVGLGLGLGLGLTIVGEGRLGYGDGKNGADLVTSCRNYTCWSRLSFAAQKNLVTLRPGGRREEGYIVATNLVYSLVRKVLVTIHIHSFILFSFCCSCDL